MPATFAELHDAALAKLEEAKAIRAKADSEDRHLTDEEIQQVEAIIQEAEKLKAQSKVQRKIETTVETFSESIPLVSTPDTPDSSPIHLPSSLPAEPRDPEKEARHGFTHIGEFALAVHKANPNVNLGFDKRLVIGAAASGMSQAVPSEGGYLMPPAFSQQIWDGLNKDPDNLIGRTDQYTVPAGFDSLTFPANAETSRATGSRYGGIRGYWRAEAEQMTSSKPKLREVRGEPHELYVFAYVTDRLLRNASAAETYLTKAATSEISFLANDSIINGNGAGKPLGILNAPCTVSQAKETGQEAATVQTENILNMWGRLHGRARRNAIWLVNQEVETQLYQMTLGIGTAGVATFLPPGGLSTVPYATLLGRPVIVTEYCAKVGTVGDIILADLSSYVSFVRGGVMSAMSIHLRFDYAETAFRWQFELDGQPWLGAALTPYKATTNRTVSTFITLATRA